MIRPLRAAAALALLTLAGGCASQQGSTANAALSQILILGEQLIGADDPPGPEPTRAALDAQPFAVIALRTEAGPGRAFLAAVGRNGDHVTYLDPDRRGVVLEGAALFQTRALGTDVTGSRASAPDPLRAPRPPSAWPAEVTRVWRFRDGAGVPFSRVLRCRAAPAGAPAPLEIKEVVLVLQEMREVCANPRHRVEQAHWIDPGDGRVWKTRQWAGPVQGMLTIEVVRPVE